MKNKKILKTLAALTLSAMAAGCIAAAGCTEEHSHTWSDKWESNAEGHWHVATCEGHTDIKSEIVNHVWDDDNDTDCNICGYVRTVTPVVNEYTVTFNMKGHGEQIEAKKVNKDEKVAKPDDPAAENYTFDGWFTDEDCTAAYDFETAVTANLNLYAKWTGKVVQYKVTYHMNGYGEQVAADTVEKVGDVAGKLTKPADPTTANYNFDGWFTDKACTAAYDFNADVTDNLELYAKWTHKHSDYDTAKWAYNAVYHYHACKTEGCDAYTDEEAHTLNADKVCTVCGAEFKDMTYTFEPSRMDATTYADGMSSGIFAVLPGTTVRTRERLKQEVWKPEAVEADGDRLVEANFSNTIYAEDGTQLFLGKSVQFNKTAVGFSVNAIAPGTLTFYAENGSSGVGAEDHQTLTLTRPDGTTETLQYLGKKIRAVVVECDQLGLYTITRGSGSTTDVYYAKYETCVPVTPVEKVEIAEKGIVLFKQGDAFDVSKLQVQIIREITGMVEPIALDDARLNIDSSAYVGNTPGTYTIKITFTEDGKEFKTEYDVVVEAVKAVELGYNAIIQGVNNSAGNQVYANHAVKQLYFKGEELDLDGLTVKAVLTSDAKFIVTEGFVVSGYNKDTAGKQIVKVAWESNPDVFAEFTVYVVDYTAADVADEAITINVYKDFTDAQVGVKAEGAYQFQTIQQSIDFLNAVNLDENTKKVISLAAGTYNEKLEINIPNLTIKGADSTDATKTVIEWDSLYGIADEGGFLHTTDSTATLNVRERAEGFVIKDITISNKFNNTAYFDEVFGPKYGEHRALAVLIQADKVVIDNCRLLGYQDTVEFFTGRQVVKNSYINGRTDFIFGTNNTTYFYKCEIESIESDGYITAFKGSNKGSNDWVEYGAIFNECKFTCSEGVTKGTTAIGRPWAAYAAVAVINSELGEHVSTAAYAGKTSGSRYVMMSGTEPTNENAKYVEYNNTGAGAITEEVAGMKMLTEAEAANYSDMSVIFAANNGNLKDYYTDAWDGSEGATIAVKTFKFSYYYKATDSYTFHETPEEGEDIFNGAATVIGGKWGHELNQKKDHAKFDAGTVIQVNARGRVYITTYGQAYGLAENLQIKYVDGYATITIVKTASSPIANGCYITMIKFDANDIPEDSEIKYDFVLGSEAANISGTKDTPAELYDGDVVVVGNLRNNGNSYQATSGAVLKFTKRGKITIDWYPYESSDENADIIYKDGYAELTIIGNPYIRSITLDQSVIPADNSTVLMTEDMVIDLTALSTAYEGTKGRYEGIEIDASKGKFALNGSGDWVQMNTGTVLKVQVVEGLYVSVVEYNNAGLVEISERDKDGFVTVTATGNTYIKSMTFTIEKLYDNDAYIDLLKLGDTTKYEGSSGSLLGVKIDATSGKFASNGSGWIQVNKDTVLKVHVGEGIVVSVVEYGDTEEGFVSKVTIGERDAEGWVTITATGNTYLKAIKTYLPLQRITQNYTYTYAQGNRNDGALEVGDTNIKFDGCKVNNAWLYYGTITMDVKAGATITIKGSEWDGEISINDNVVAPDKNADGFWYYTYTVMTDGVVTISSNKGYLRVITVEFAAEAE